MLALDQFDEYLIVRSAPENQLMLPTYQEASQSRHGKIFITCVSWIQATIGD